MKSSTENETLCFERRPFNVKRQEVKYLGPRRWMIAVIIDVDAQRLGKMKENECIKIGLIVL